MSYDIPKAPTLESERVWPDKIARAVARHLGITAELVRQMEFEAARELTKRRAATCRAKTDGVGALLRRHLESLEQKVQETDGT